MRSPVWRTMIAASIAALGLFAAPLQAKADPVADFYKGKTVTLTWAGQEGGTYATFGQAFIRHMAKHVPGQPTMIMRYMPGAGGLRYANHAAGVEQADGTFLGMITTDTVLYGFMFPDKVSFKPDQFQWIGSIARVQPLISVWHTKPFKTIEDLRAREAVMGATGKGSPSFQYLAIANNLLGTKIRPVLGYKGNQDMILAVERGEIDGQENTWDSWATGYPHWIAEKKLVHLVQFGTQRLPALPDVPLAIELVTNPDDKAVMEFHSSLLAAGRPIFVPSGVPAERVEALRKAFLATLKDPEYLAEAKKLSIEAESALDGAAVQALVLKAGSAPASVKSRAAQVIDLP